MIKRISKAAIFITALIICMIPKNTGATSNSVTITTPASACYDQATGIVTVKGTISSSNADVTLLAVRSFDQITDAQVYLESVPEIEKKIIYIDQIGVEDFANYTVNDGGTANWQVSFIPKPGISGGWITVFVGGTNVDVVKLVSFSAQVPAPGITANPWYKGDDLVMKIHKAGDVYTSYGDENAITAWGNAIDKVLVNGSEFDNYTIDSSAETITFMDLESVSSIKITTIDGIYAEINMYGLILAPIGRPAGTITAVSSTVVENDEATVSFNLSDSYLAGWLAEINESMVTYKESTASEYASVSSYALVDGVLTVGMASINSVESKNFTVKIAVPDYEEKTANVTVISPTRAARDAFTASHVSSRYKNPETLSSSEYGVTVTTPYQGLYGSSVTWKLQKMYGYDWVDITDLTSGTEYLLGRTNTAFMGGEYRVLATITNGAYSPNNWSKSFSVYPYGVSDEATLSFIVANRDTSKTDIYEGDTFTVTTVISGLSTWAGAQIAFNYDPQKIMLLSETPVYSVASDTNKYMSLPPSFSEGFIDYTVVLNIINNPNTSEAITNDFQVVSFEFKALKAGSMGLAFSPDETIVPVNLDINADKKFTSQAFEVLEIPPVAPSASELAFEESELRFGYTAHADFKFVDENADDEGTHIYKWYIDGAVVEGVTGSEFVISNAAYVGKELTFSVLPVSDNPNDPKADEAYMTDGYLILANADFKPTVQYEAPAKITAFEEAEVEASLVETFENMTDSSVVNWYIVNSSDATIEDGAIPLVSGSTTATFEKEYNGKYAIIEILPRATVAGEQYQGTAVYSNAIKITANAAATPSSPVILDYTNNSITIAPTEGYEYSLNGTDWYSSAIFNELLPGTVYYVYQRVAETEYLLASDASAGTMVTLYNESYNIEFKNYDGTLLQKTAVSFGTLPDYAGNTPEKPASEQYNYTFSGWSPQFQTVKQDAVYEAQFTESLREYTVAFKNYDNSILQNYSVEYGSIPQYTGETPVKPSSVQYYYTFSGWTPEFVAVTGEMVYIAQYISNLREYDVTFIYENNKDPNTTVRATYGYTINAPKNPVRAGYTFLGWYETNDYGVTLSDQPFVFSKPITKETVLCAKWELSEDAAEFINGKMVVVSTSAYSDATVMIASYKGNRLISTIKIVRDIKIGDNLISNEELSGFTTENADLVKVIIWKQVSNLKPLKEVIKIKLS